MFKFCHKAPVFLSYRTAPHTSASHFLRPLDFPMASPFPPTPTPALFMPHLPRVSLILKNHVSKRSLRTLSGARQMRGLLALRGDSGAPAPARQPQVKFLPGDNRQMWGWPALAGPGNVRRV